MELVKSNSIGRISIELRAVEVGDGLLVAITGGKAHIGAAAVGISYGSLATSSVITVPGHRDDRVAKDAAEKLSKASGKTVVVVAGIHYNDMSREEIGDALRLCDELVEGLAGEICKRR
jgi:hypothetical protein